MSALTFPIQPEGLVCGVLVGLNGDDTAALYAAGQPILAPVRCRGLIDTGADVTCVAPAVLRQLGLNVPIMQTRTHTAIGGARVDIFEVSLSVLDFGNPGGPMLVLPDLQVMEALGALPNLEVLIGLDVLLTLRLEVDGPGRSFTLDF